MSGIVEKESATAAEDAEKAETAPAQQQARDTIRPSLPFRKFIPTLIAAYLTMFIISLDRTILSTAIPTITNEFHSIKDIGWYAAAYMFTNAALQLVFGKLYSFHQTKHVLLISLLLFEIGSAVCGSAPNSGALIGGRSIAGLGASGVMSGTMMLIVDAVPLHQRTIFIAAFSSVFAISSIAGPLLGGAFTTKVSWRWCFYINLPVGAIAAPILWFIVPETEVKVKDLTVRERIKRLDPLGTMAFIPGVVCLLLALSWGGNTYAWSNARIIVLFILAGLLLTLFGYIQHRLGEKATIPRRLFKSRTVIAAFYYNFMNPGSFFLAIYYLPIYLQAIKGLNPLHSGEQTMPLAASFVTGSLFSGVMTRKSGYYVPSLIASPVVAAIGVGLLSTLRVDSSRAHWIGFEVLFGFGLGLGMQQAQMAVQNSLKSRADIALGTSMLFFLQALGGTIWITVGQIVFSHSLVSHISKITSIKIPAELILRAGATNLRDLVPKEQLHDVLVAYNAAITDTFHVAVALASVTIFAGLTMEWKKIPEPKKGEKMVVAKQTEEKPSATDKIAPSDDASHSVSKPAMKNDGRVPLETIREANKESTESTSVSNEVDSEKIEEVKTEKAG